MDNSGRYSAATSTVNSIADTRDKILQAVTYTFSIIVLPALFLSVNKALDKHLLIEAAIYIVAYIAWIFFGIFLSRKLTYKTRSFIILLLVYIVGVFILVQRGLSGGGTLFLVTFCIMSTALLGLKYGLLAIAASVCSIIFVGVAMVGHLLPFDAEIVWNSTSMISWTLAGAVFLVLSVCMVWTSGILQTRLLNTLSELRDSQEKIASQNISLIKEIEDRKELEKQKKEIEKQLFQSQKLESIGTLAGGIAHDFNNILTPIIGYTELVLYDIEKGTLLENNLQEIYIAAKRAKDLVKQILLFARQTEEAPKPVQVDLIAKEAMKLLRSSIPTSVEIRQHIKSSALIMGNPTQVHQIFMNLCTNAAHAMENDGGIMEVRLTDIEIDTEFNKPHSNIEPGNYIQLSVSDTGTGIPPDVIESIFEPYFTTKASGKGTGMGLATVHGIVKSYGGEIWAESELGKGAVFTIYLPITKKRTEDKLYQPEVLPTGVERILFVDDDLPIVNMNSQVLDRLGYQVTAQTSSIKALELFCSKPNDFDLVITDMTMPNMTGDKLAFELMKIRPDIPVILCTGYSKRISDTVAAEIGIKAFAYKPVVTADLAKMVRTVLDEAKKPAQSLNSELS